MDILDPQCANTSTGVANPLIIHLVTTLLTNYCNTSPKKAWPADYGPRAIEKKNDTYDFIVIGAGSAGSVVASRLAEDPKQRVLLIEAGNDPPIESEIPGLGNSLQRTEFDWMYLPRSNGKSCLGFINDNCVWSKGRVLGGSSSINGMVYVRGNARDYDTWEKLGNPSWNWDNVTKYFKLSENFNGKDQYSAHGRGGPLSVEAYRAPKKDQMMIFNAAKELKHNHVKDFVAGHDLGFGFLYGTLKNGRRCSTAKAYLKKERENLHIVKNAVAKRINFDADKRAHSVTFVINDDYEITTNASKEIIVSAGSIEAPKLLMLSGIGPKNHLEKFGIPTIQALPVGENLQDHNTVALFLKLEKQPSQKNDDIDDIYNEWAHSFGPLSMGLLNVGAFVNTKRDSRFPNIQYAYLPVPDIDAFGARLKHGIIQSIRQQIGPKDRLMVVFVLTLKPKSRGRVRLASADYKDKPLIFSNYLGHEDDIKNLVEGINEHLKFEKTRPFRQHKAEFLKLDLPDCNKFEYRSDEYWACYAKYMTTTIYHYVGTVKMGPSSDPSSIVDHQLRVHGVKNLRVIDASIMPTITSGNTNAPSIMIGEKGADYVKASWNLQPREI